MKKNLFGFTLFLLCCNFQINAQCPIGEIEVSIEVTTDAYGYEGYWQLVPSGNDCDEATIFEGGNIIQVGCSGAGEEDATTAFGYGDNITITEGMWCLEEGAFYDIIFVDDWGDGGFDFTVLIGEEEFAIYEFEGSDEGNTFTFEASPPLDWDVYVDTITSYPYQNMVPVSIDAKIFNYSANTITSLDLNYSVDGGTAVTETVVGLNINPFTEIIISHPTLWTPPANAIYSIEFWTSDPNGNTDMNISNDNTQKILTVGDPIPDIINNYISNIPIFTVVGNSSNGIDKPKDLDFHPILSNFELWIVNAGTEETGGETVTFYNAGQPGQTIIEKKDGNAWHFMSLPTGIAFSQNTNFANSPGVLDANHGGGHFTGPALWSSDMEIYGEPSGGNGSHLDMIHQQPYAMGIEYDIDNAFWVYNGYDNTIDWVDFVKDHGPGNDDHADGRVRRYSELEVDFEDLDIPSHIVLHKETNWLYIVDNGNSRILRMDVSSGEEGSPFTPYAEPLAETIYMENVIWEEYLTDGFAMPCGIEVIGNNLMVGDYETGEIIIYDISGTLPVELERINTGAAGLTGIKVGPDGKIWYVNALTDELVRIDFGEPVSINNSFLQTAVSIYPNPATEQLNININNFLMEDMQVVIYNLLGEIVYNNKLTTSNGTINVSAFPAGSYQLEIKNNIDSVIKTFVVLR